MSQPIGYQQHQILNHHLQKNGLLQPARQPSNSHYRRPSNTKTVTNPHANVLRVGMIVKSRWRIEKKLGNGAYGETYAAKDLTTNESVAIKSERVLPNKAQTLKLEAIIMKDIQSCPHVVRFLYYGQEKDYNVLAMEQLGENLAVICKQMPNNIYSLATTLRLGIQMLDLLEGLHKLGYIHRDVKPANFVIGRVEGKRDKVYLIDFGLARKFLLPNGDVRPPREKAGFRGTPRYASVNSHLQKELSRRDDVWSLFYILVEFATGYLPWRKISSKQQIGELKEKYTNPDLVKKLPTEFVTFMDYLKTLKYEDVPDYNYLRSLLYQAYKESNFTNDMPLDWMDPDNLLSSSKLSSISSSLHPSRVPSGTSLPVGVDEDGQPISLNASNQNGISDKRGSKQKPGKRNFASQQVDKDSSQNKSSRKNKSSCKCTIM